MRLRNILLSFFFFGSCSKKLFVVEVGAAFILPTHSARVISLPAQNACPPHHAPPMNAAKVKLFVYIRMNKSKLLSKLGNQRGGGGALRILKFNTYRVHWSKCSTWFIQILQSAVHLSGNATNDCNAHGTPVPESYRMMIGNKYICFVRSVAPINLCAVDELLVPAADGGASASERWRKQSERSFYHFCLCQNSYLAEFAIVFFRGHFFASFLCYFCN